MGALRLEGRVAVVTGGSSGIGLAVGREVLAEGGRVALFARDAGRLEEARRSLGGDVLTVAGDVTRTADLDRLMDETVRRWARVDVVVANAGVARFQPVDRVDEATIDHQLAVNVKGTFLTVQRALPHMPRGGSVVLVASNAHYMGVATAAIYCASKGAVRSMGRSLAAELVPRGIRVNVVSPGPTETPIFETMGLSREHLTALRMHMQKEVPMKRIADPAEIARAIVFLASDAASYVTGEDLCVDGGWVALG